MFSNLKLYLQIKFADYNFTSSNDLNLNWILNLNKTSMFDSLVIFEGTNVRMRLDKLTVRKLKRWRSLKNVINVIFLAGISINGVQC
jgi:hypothetical protein